MANQLLIAAGADSFDVIKSRIHNSPPGTHRNLVDCGRTILREEGLQVMYRGITAALLRGFCLHGLIFLGYESTLRAIRKAYNVPEDA